VALGDLRFKAHYFGEEPTRLFEISSVCGSVSGVKGRVRAVRRFSGAVGVRLLCHRGENRQERQYCGSECDDAGGSAAVESAAFHCAVCCDAEFEDAGVHGFVSFGVLAAWISMALAVSRSASCVRPAAR